MNSQSMTLSHSGVKMTPGHQCWHQILPNIYFVNKNLPRSLTWASVPWESSLPPGCQFPVFVSRNAPPAPPFLTFGHLFSFCTLFYFSFFLLLLLLFFFYKMHIMSSFLVGEKWAVNMCDMVIRNQACCLSYWTLQRKEMKGKTFSGRFFCIF